MNRAPLRRTRFGMATVMFAAGGMLLVPIVEAPPSGAQKTPEDQAEQLLQDARAASAEADFTGVVQVEWVDPTGRHREQVEARSVGGVLELQDHRDVYGHNDQRLVQSDGGYTSMGNSHAGGELPSPTPKWDLRVSGSHRVAGRATLVIKASDPDTGTARERVYVDRSTHLVLRREQLDSRGHVQRAIGFVRVNQAKYLGSHKPKVPRSQENLQPERLRNLPKGYLAPKRVGDRYELLGQYRRPDGTVQLFYSDGIFGLSMFEQRGELDWGALPPGATVRSIGGHEARQYATPGGEVLVWTAAGTIFTSVSDAPSDEVDAWVVDFLPTEHSSAVDSIAKFVLGPFGWE